MLRTMNIGKRAAAAFAGVGVLMLLLGGYALWQTGQLADQSRQVTNEVMPALEEAMNIDVEFLRVRVQTANFTGADNDAERTRYRQRIEEVKKGVTAAFERLSALVTEPEEKRLLAQFDTAYQEYLQVSSQVFSAISQNNFNEAARLRDEVQLPLTGQISTTLDELVAFQKREGERAATNVESISSSVTVGVIIAIVVAIIAMTLLAWRLTLSLTRPIEEALVHVERIAGGDLRVAIKAQGHDEPARMLQGLEDMRNRLQRALATIQSSSEQLASTSEELNSVTDDSSRHIASQTEQLEQAATAINELTAAVDTVAKDAQSASESSDYADERAQRGRALVGDTEQSIEALSGDMGDSATKVQQLADKVNQITTVLDVIRAIADQTNLLALNAAIEAARAGESGRGFSVVADEVRALAHRTQQSTVEIEDLVKSVQGSSKESVTTMQQSVERAQQTLERARSAGEALKEIATAVAEINNRNTSIASAAEEQAAVARDVDKNLVSIRDLSNSTASGAEQTASSAEELARLAVQLNTLINEFKL